VRLLNPSLTVGALIGAPTVREGFPARAQYYAVGALRLPGRGFRTNPRCRQLRAEPDPGGGLYQNPPVNARRILAVPLPARRGLHRPLSGREAAARVQAQDFTLSVPFQKHGFAFEETAPDPEGTPAAARMGAGVGKQGGAGRQYLRPTSTLPANAGLAANPRVWLGSRIGTVEDWHAKAPAPRCILA
jgi:hypothetical protein